MTDLYPNLFKNLTRNPITIILLDGRKQTMVYDKTTRLKTLFEETCYLCNIDGDNLFGFATLMDDYFAFLNLDIKVCKINFKELSRKSQNNVLFQPNLTYYSPVHKSPEENRRLSQGHKRLSDNNKLLQSTSSTKSAPVYRAQDPLNAIDQDDTPVIYFRLKSYVYSHCLRDKTTKSLYFLQLLRNVLDYKLKCVDEIYLQLGSFAIQAFYGDYNYILSSSYDERRSVTSTNTESSNYSHSPTLARLSRICTLSSNFTKEQVESGRYFEPNKFFPSWIISKYTRDYLFKEIPQLHKSLSGMSRVESEFSYIRMASAQYSNFNMHLFPVRDQKLSGFSSGTMPLSSVTHNTTLNGVKTTKNKLWLGLSPAGLEMHQMKNAEHIEHLSTLKWSDIDEVTHKSTGISVHVGCRNLKLHTNTKMQADHLFWLTRHMHIYQTKARFNASCSAEALESADRQKYREKYVYMDLEDLKLNGVHTPDVVDSYETFSFDESNVVPSVVRLPFVNTPAALPRRTPSKARPLKMKDLIRMANSGHDSSNVSPVASFHVDKQPQYIKKSRPTSQTSNYAPINHKGLRSPDIQTQIVNDSPYHCRLFSDDIEKTDSDQSTSKLCDNLDDSDRNSSFIDSDSKSSAKVIVVKPPGRFVSLTKDLLTETDNLSTNSSSHSPEPSTNNVLAPPTQFRESGSVTINIGKSTSFDVSDRSPQDKQTLLTTPQRHQSDPLISYAQLSRTVPLLIGLCHEFNNTDIIDNIKSTKLSRLKTDNVVIGNSTAMKSWKSDVLFNLSTCLDDDDDDNDDYGHNNDNYNDEVFTNGHKQEVTSAPHHQRVNSLSRRAGSYHDLISLSSSCSDTDHSLNDHDSVDISSISSFEYNDIKYSRINIGQSTQVTII